MLGHLGINVADLEAARAYYDALMPVLGYDLYFHTDDQCAYRPEGENRGAFIFLYPALEPGSVSQHRPGLQHLAFIVPTRRAVYLAHQTACDLGSNSVHAPRAFPEYPPPYFAAFWTDPWGLMFEAVCHHDRDGRTQVKCASLQ